ncbi:mannose/cellobiose epimerase-like protein (N-acyl-D-glucosamine 2-epimerase family) [Luteibacter rhizovicinus]|uniref:Mannose/cellobiose epimerase-like protein (N-acyl-D-glucosamine 2-epimerase family) n=1 Tax=Luteibacter rhizovicinus TaxID=242606 RepID=A0A4R3YS52_9GAMM|nr:AGE family epimerase/isomerase [Luteibacter rhizovicinus]TCV93883.1 mannose/cellobiose epimerase-like protein (N-acyl-D-glucosamine 2-epimerase family) [Luteibacter rhizovicinus]
MTTVPLPDFRSADVLRAHIAKTMAFYKPNEIDPAGGFLQYFKDDGSVYNRTHRHLVSSTRFVFNHAMAAIEFGKAEDVEAARHGLKYLREVHRNPETGGYAWTIESGKPEDETYHCYGVAFVLLAYSCGVKAGITEAAAWMDETWDLFEKRYWDPAYGLYKDEADKHWNFSGYRGQNANMHTCEAMIAAYEATGNDRYLDRALLLADNMTQRQAKLGNGLIWEHYDIHWNVDWKYNLDNPKHLFRPWGFQPGHQTEWAKLLLMLDRYTTKRGQSIDWLVPTAQHFFDKALAHAWDDEHGGIAYGFSPEGDVCDDDKYFWVQAESLAAAALLHDRTGEPRYAVWYDRIWAYSWEHFVDHKYGAWYRILTRDNRKYDDEKSPAGKTDYHTMGACYEVMALIRRGGKP